MKTIKYIFCLGVFFVLGACTSTTLISQSGGMQTVIANAKNANDAVKVANNKASRICAVEGAKLKIIDLDTIYQGNDPNQQSLVDLAKQILPASKTEGPYIPAKHTYKATLTFRCI